MNEPSPGSEPSADFVPLADYREFPVDEMQRRSAAFLAEMQRRRSVRRFSDRPVPRGVIDDCLRAAGTAPSGANQQPWHFVVVADPAIKGKIRASAEREERRFYEQTAPQEWLDAVMPLATGPQKPFLEEAPLLISVFAERYRLEPDGSRSKRYYPVESTGIATGLLIAALHHAGLATLTYTPGRMGFLNEILGRPKGERPMLILVTGYPAGDAVVPQLAKKSLDEIVSFV